MEINLSHLQKIIDNIPEDCEKALSENAALRAELDAVTATMQAIAKQRDEYQFKWTAALASLQNEISAAQKKLEGVKDPVIKSRLVGYIQGLNQALYVLSSSKKEPAKSLDF